MKRNDFYEVDGCTDFIPVKLIEEHKHMTNTLKVELTQTGCRAFVPITYSFPKVNEPKKPVVPKFVAEWIEDHKGDYSKWDEEARADFVFRAINDLFRFGEGLSSWDFTIDEKISEWTTKNAYEFITAILFGYTVEKEKLYTVEIGGTDSCKLFKNIKTNKFLFHSGNGLKGYTDRLTEKEIKQKDERLWQFVKEVE